MIGEPLGEGGFAMVVRAHDEVLDHEVAIKLLSDEWLDRGDVRARFLDEARLLRRIESTRVASVLDIGETELGRPYLVLNLANRGTVADLMRSGPIPIDRVVRLGVDVALGVADLHHQGVLHRDLKPSNILLVSGADGGEERVLITDLGLAKRLELASGFTMGAGTAGYAAPEQFAPGGDLDVRADVYSLGALVRSMLLTSRGRRGAGERQARERVSAVVSKALSADRQERQPSAEAFATELQAAVRGRNRRNALGPRPSVGVMATTGVAAIVVALLGGAGGVELRAGDRVWLSSDAAGLSLAVPEDVATNVASSSWEMAGQTNPPDGFVATADLTTWADPTTATRGVFVAIGVDVDRESVRAQVAHEGCEADRLRSWSNGALAGEVVEWLDCPGDAAYYEGLFPTGAGEAVLYVQGVDLTEAEYEAVLRSVRFD